MGIVGSANWKMQSGQRCHVAKHTPHASVSLAFVVMASHGILIRFRTVQYDKSLGSSLGFQAPGIRVWMQPACRAQRRQLHRAIASFFRVQSSLRRNFRRTCRHGVGDRVKEKTRGRKPCPSSTLMPRFPSAPKVSSFCCQVVAFRWLPPTAYMKVLLLTRVRCKLHSKVPLQKPGLQTPDFTSGS